MREGQNADVAIAAQHQGPEIAGVQLVDAHQFTHGVGQLVDAVIHFHAINLGGIEQAADVFAHPEDGRPGGRGVAADAFEHGAAVAGNVGKDVDFGIVPVDQAAVMPNLFRGL